MQFQNYKAKNKNAKNKKSYQKNSDIWFNLGSEPITFLSYPCN